MQGSGRLKLPRIRRRGAPEYPERARTETRPPSPGRWVAIGPRFTVANPGEVADSPEISSDEAEARGGGNKGLDTTRTSAMRLATAPFGGTAPTRKNPTPRGGKNAWLMGEALL